MEFFYKMVIANTFILSFALTKWYQLSPICAADGPPFLSRKELRFACFPFISFRILAFLQKCYSQNPPADWLCKSALLSSNLLPFFYARSRTAGLQFRHSVHPRRFRFPYCSHCISRSVMGKKSSSGPTSQSSPLKYFHSGFPSV